MKPGLSLPRLGTNFTVETESSGRTVSGLSRIVRLFTGLSDSSFAGIPLPLDLSTVEAIPCAEKALALLAPGDQETRELRDEIAGCLAEFRGQ